MRKLVVVAVGLSLVLGCGQRRSSLLLERYARGPIDDSIKVGMAVERTLEPIVQEKEQGGIKVTAQYASAGYLKEFFSNEAVFGQFAGPNPYYPEHIVFYVKVENMSNERILINPTQFVLVDDRGNQYSPIGVDHVTAYAEFRAPVSTATRGVLNEARPGYFGLSLPVGRVMGAQPQGRFALIKQSSIQTGFLYPEVTHDGLVAFWSPATEATQLKLLVTNIKTQFDANDWPQSSLEFSFDFNVILTEAKH